MKRMKKITIVLVISLFFFWDLLLLLQRQRESAIITVFGCFNNRPAPLITRVLCWTWPASGPGHCIVVLTGRCGTHHPVASQSKVDGCQFIIHLGCQRNGDGGQQVGKKKKKKRDCRRISSCISSSTTKQNKRTTQKRKY